MMDTTPERRGSWDSSQRGASIELGPVHYGAHHELRSAASEAPILSKPSQQSFKAEATSGDPPPVLQRPKESIANTSTFGWDGDDDPENPYNWPLWRINVNSALLALLAFLIPFSSAIMAPSTATILAEFGSENQLLEAFVVSSFVLAMAFGPLIWAPLSEIYGRIPIYHITSTGFLAFTIGCAVAPSLASLIVFRFFAGFFGSCITANGGASFGDMIRLERRAAYMSFFIMGPILGPVAGPIGGGFLATAKGWRWVFWLIAIAGGFNAVMMVIFCRETYAPLILRRKARRNNVPLDLVPGSDLTPWAVLKRGIRRPMKLLVRSPLGALLAVYMALIYGFLYLMISSISQVFINTYGFSLDLSGLAYLGLGIGCLSGNLLVSLTSDRYMMRRAARQGGEKKPEYRNFWVPMGAICIPAGFFIYGWTAEYHVHWIVPIIGTFFIGFGFNTVFNSVLLYLIESFTIYAASALAANGVVRNLGGGLLPLAGLTLYGNLGDGWGNSVLGFIQVALVLPMTVVVVRYGEYLRKTYAITDL
ncbi:hypothetical protein VP1G_01139 [Cytospora mali]|uniref:Major facilitator superfamily (MFS) profile domain-containing protein n=1 Tax=Cytospora mali TaxID=578113 RepID=A0A194UQ59_CYTMA|nr:hypothetical protein VP1G_01139 [Valsa mali var. pyri (nom. inval.)]